MAGFPGSWKTPFQGDLLGQLAVLPRADRVSRPRQADAASYQRSSTAAVLDELPEARVHEDSRLDVVKGRRAATVLNAELFRSALGRERRRADRSDERFALVTIAVDKPLAGRVAAALNAATRETDVVGWLDQGHTLAAILSDVSESSGPAVAGIQTRLQRELTSSVDAGAVPRIRTEWYVHAGPRTQGTLGLADADPLLDELRLADARRTVPDALKRAFDVLGSLALLVLLAPVLLLLAALVKLTSRGPVLFKQVRVGQLARPFTMLKFRTMQANSDSRLHQHFVTQFIKSSDEMKQAGTDFFKIQNDPRVTPIGHLLRKTSLDELPQLWNVLRGDMSLVGPRPPLVYELEQYRPWHWRRVLEGKPGITGLWQVTGRSRTTFDEMVRLDVRYVRARGLWTDVRILLATPRAVVTGKGAC
jgi:lipopolysaccharide/colanic/teichoic acid biosynthesis glycosyltransferase